MNKSHPSFSVDECKIKASLLLKSLYSTNENDIQQAVKRFQRLPEFRNVALSDIQEEAKHKHALFVIALEKGFSSWTELKYQLPLIRGGFLNHWFAKYHDAKLFQNNNGGYLFPYQKQFFICDSNYIIQLGFDVDDPDWELIDYDWAKPKDEKALKRIKEKWLIIQEKQNK